MRLSAISGQHQQFLLLGLDQPILLAQQLGLEINSDASRLQLENIFQEIVAAYSPLATGVVLSAELGYAAAAKKSADTGLVFCLERTLSESDPFSIPILQNNWSVEYVRNNYALAKLLLYAHSEEAELVTKLELVNELYDSCRYEGIDFLLELRVIDGKRLGDEAFQEQQSRLVRFFRGQCDLLALEYPRTALGCVSVVAQLQMPWILIESGQAEYGIAKEELRTALAGGATGLVVSRFVLPTFKRGSFQLDQFRAYLQKEGRDRMLELARICDEAVVK